MSSITIQILRFVDEYQPGFVECELIDAMGQVHLFIEKAPVVSSENLWPTSTYPCKGSIACVVEKDWIDESGRQLLQVNTELPWVIESNTGNTRFVILASQLTKDNHLDL